MSIIIGVRYKAMGQTYHYNTDGIIYNVGDKIIANTDRGVECGDVIISNREHKTETIHGGIIRMATNIDIQNLLLKKEKESKAFALCNEKISKHKISMELIEVEYIFDNSKIIFYFTAEGRVDFRELVKDLASVYHTRIELRQIGVRDEAKLLNGVGICGRELCCSTFLEDFEPVTINMAKDQGLSLNPTKISGNCGRLMCCLKYEQEGYEYLSADAPTLDTYVKTPDSEGIVVDVSLLKGCCRVRSKAGEVTTHKFESLSQCKNPNKKQG